MRNKTILRKKSSDYLQLVLNPQNLAKLNRARIQKHVSKKIKLLETKN
jgi:hypothetical protein